MNNLFQYRDGQLYCEEVALTSIAKQVGTPAYVYSRRMIADRFKAYDDGLAAIPHTVCYAVKANSNLSVLQLLARAGAGFDVVSGGELFRVLKAGGDAANVVFSGVGKTASEMRDALELGLLSFNCESEPELQLLAAISKEMDVRPNVAIRVNPDVNASTHPYISTGLKEHKFGIDIALVEDVYERARDLGSLEMNGVSCHIGSQLLDDKPLIEAAEKLLALVDRLTARGFAITHFDFGGGLGVAYQPGEHTPSIATYTAKLTSLLEGRQLRLMIEPGRSIVAQAGVLLSQVLYNKRNGEKNFVIVDAAMNDLIRPALYQAHHPIMPLQRRATTNRMVADVVGPVCESGDFLARDREIERPDPGEYLAFGVAGAYGFAQSSQYNSRPRAAEVMVDGAQWRIIRQRETLSDLVRGE